MQRKLIVTSDGSHSVSIPEMNVTYHSIHGAIQESKHVFIEGGLYNVLDAEQPRGSIRIFEMGFGTGLNALLTLIASEKLQQKIFYEAIEPFPLTAGEVGELNYCDILNRKDLQPIFEVLHSCDWKKEIAITNKFFFKRSNSELQNYKASELKNLIYFDAFDPNVQPELWTTEIFESMFSILEPKGVLVTYSSKGTARRAMEAAGFSVEKLSGPPGKREMIRGSRRAGYDLKT